MTDSEFDRAVADILDEGAHLEARLRAMYLIKNDGKTYKNAEILMKAATLTDSVLLEHELYYNLGQFQLTGRPCADAANGSSSSSSEGDDIIRFLMKIISSTSPKHDSISRHEALEALGAIFADPEKGLTTPVTGLFKPVAAAEDGVADNASAFPHLRAEVCAYLSDISDNERILSVRQSAELARDRLLHADATREQYAAKLAEKMKRWQDAKDKEAAEAGDEEDNEGPSSFFTEWIAPSQVHPYLSVDPSPAFDEEENDAILTSYKRFQNIEKARARVAELALILRNEVKKKKSEVLVAAAAPADDSSAVASASPNSNEGEEEIIVAGDYSLFDRYRAMFSLRNIGIPEAIEVLSESLNADKSSALLRHEVAFVLGQIEKNSCEKALIDCLCNTKEAGMVRHEAAIAIGGIAQPSGLAALELHSKDRDRIVADSCIAGLEMHRYWSDFLERARAHAAESEAS